MPELPEVEGYRALAEQGALGRVIAAVDAPDAWYLKRGLDDRTIEAVLVGRTVTAARRRGKLMLLDIGAPPAARTRRSRSATSGVEAAAPEAVLGVHFGMSGRLLVDGRASVDRLLYTTGTQRTVHDRFALRFADGGSLVVRDPRRLGGVELDPDEDRLGPDALGVTLRQLRVALSGTVVALKARLLDQRHLAGVGNLMADEILWRVGLLPGRPCSSLTDADVRRLQRHLVSGIRLLIDRGGSHTGDLQPHRHPGGACPKDGMALSRGQVGGRTTWWCPRHQL
jgi:formamidopyrimidine-DNA glycosylase